MTDPMLGLLRLLVQVGLIGLALVAPKNALQHDAGRDPDPLANVSAIENPESIEAVGIVPKFV
jgi:hypothetical protein